MADSQKLICPKGMKKGKDKSSDQHEEKQDKKEKLQLQKRRLL